MRQSSRKKPALLAVLALLLGLVGVALPSTPASAAAVMPTLRWPAVNSMANDYHQTTTSPKGAVTVGCRFTGTTPSQDLITRGPTGSISRQLDRTASVDGTIKNCITRPVVDKKGDLYGKPSGSTKLFAYSGNTLKWKYSTGCTSSEPVVGADGNIYFLNGDGKLIGVKPSLDAGQTTPTKVFEMDVETSCSQGNQIYAYSGGIAVERNYATDLRYVTYGEDLIADLPGEVDYVQGQTPVNSEGRVFFLETLANSLKVSVYDPNTQKVAWSTVASTPGAQRQGMNWLVPTAFGGVVVTIREQRMVNGLPVMPEEYVTNLVTLNFHGLKVNTTTLSNKDSSGNVYGNNFFAADVTGKLVVVRNITIQRTSSPYQVPGVDIFVIDQMTGSQTYSSKIRGNLNTSDGDIYGYQIRTSDTSVKIGPDALYLNTVKCSSDSSCAASTSYTLRAIEVVGLGMDYPRGTVLATVPRPATPYLALGDSFSSGEGNSPFENGTDLDGFNTCHRSDYAYPRLISGTSANIPALGTSGFRACSGAVSNNVWKYAQWNEGIQLGLWPDTSTQLVTLTIGGNDIGFADFAKACVIPTDSCAFGSSAYATVLQKIDQELPDKLKDTYRRILAHAPAAKIYVAGYPQVAENKNPEEIWDIKCPYFRGVTTGWDEAYAARDVVSRLNGKIDQAVKHIQAESPGNQRLKYVPMDGEDSPFKGHEVCTDSSWFQNLDELIHNEAYIFHPNSTGQRDGYAVAFKAAINAG